MKGCVEFEKVDVIRKTTIRLGNCRKTLEGWDKREIVRKLTLWETIEKWVQEIERRLRLRETAIRLK